MSASNFWINALSTFLGAAAGALVGGLIAFGIFRNESKERAKVRVDESKERADSRALLTQENYEVRFTEALGRLLEEIALYANSLRPVNVADDSRGDFLLDTAICVAQIVAKGKDRDMIRMVQRAFHRNRHSDSATLRVKLGVLSAVLTKWRIGDMTFDDALHEIEGWANRKEIPESPSAEIERI